MTAASTPVEGAIVYVFDAGTAAYVGNALTDATGDYALALPPGTYNLWVQTNTLGYPDQAYGPDGTFENATDITLPPDADADVALVAAPVTHAISGTVTAASTPVEGAIVYVFDAGTAAYVGNALTDASRRLRPGPAPRHLQPVGPDQHTGLPRPGLRPRRELRERHRHHPAARRRRGRRARRGTVAGSRAQARPARHHGGSGVVALRAHRCMPGGSGSLPTLNRANL